jgi:glucokinase
MKRVVLVNGVPASGKSTLARLLAADTGWPLLALDTVKEALFAHLGAGDRERNRLLGRASYQAIFAAIGDFPAGATAIVDAWFGFQPREVLVEHLQRAGVERVVEVWLRASPELVAARYAERAKGRIEGHPGLEYVPELEALARRAAPLGGFPLIEVDAESAFEIRELADEARRRLGPA